jgi:uncharacterized membrane protein YeaQ/YmgE (transglycosylase-associated protein family)
MSIFAWIVLGLVSGFIASKIVNSGGGGLAFPSVRHAGRHRIESV